MLQSPMDVASGFFADDVLAGVDGLEGDIGVREVRRGYYDDIDVRVGYERGGAAIGRSHAQSLRREGESGRIAVCQRDDVGTVAEALAQIAPERVEAARSRSDYSESNH